MGRKYDFAIDEYYHVFNRGNNKRPVFLDRADRKRFLYLLYVCNSNNPVAIKDINGDPFSFERGDLLVHVGAYCLLKNHFHLLLREVTEDGISKFMQKVSTGYTMYFNRRYEQTGSLFEGRFRGVHVENDIHLEYLYAYIHLNPVAHIEPEWKEKGLKNIPKAEEYLQTYEYSSFLDYPLEKRVQGKILNPESFPNYFSSEREFKRLHEQYLIGPDEV